MRRSSLALALVSVVVAAASSPLEAAPFRRGDVNANGGTEVGDAIRIFGFLFLGEPEPDCLDAADANDSGLVDIADGSYLLGFLFLGTRPPPPPFGSCGEDPTTDSLRCDRFAPCGEVDDELCANGRDDDGDGDVDCDDLDCILVADGLNERELVRTDLVDLVTGFRIPGSGSEGFVEPPQPDLRDFRLACQRLFSGDIDGAYTRFNRVGYTLLYVADTGDFGRERWVAFEWAQVDPSRCLRGGGTFIWDPGASVPVVMHAPHPFDDSDTLEESLWLLRATDAAGLFIAGTHRCANSNPTPCNGSTTRCGGQYRESDVAHFTNSFFQMAHAATLNVTPSPETLAVHGTGFSTAGLHAVVTNGTTNDDAGLTRSVRLRNALDRRLDLGVGGQAVSCNVSADSAIAAAEGVCGQSGTQGRLTNGVADPCVDWATSAAGTYLQIEQSRTLRRASDGDEISPRLLADAMLESYQPAGLLPPRFSRFGQERSEAAVETGDAFATALAVGDFDDDGSLDLVAGVPGESYDGATGAGVVIVHYGGPGVVANAGYARFGQELSGAAVEDGDSFGRALAAGDFNADGIDDLAIGMPGESYGGATEGGIVVVQYGDRDGIRSGGFARFGQELAGAEPESGDRFGEVLVSGDFDGDGVGDLVVGMPQESYDGAGRAGIVLVFFGSSGGISQGDKQRFGQELSGAAVEAGDLCGSALAVGDFDADGIDDLAMGVPGEDVGAALDCGLVIVHYGSSRGFRSDRFARFTQTLSGGSEETGDRFGAALAAGDFNGDGIDDLAVGSPGEDDGASNTGLISVHFGSRSGVTRGGQARLGVSRFHDDLGDLRWLGTVLAAGDFDGDGIDDLVAGQPDSGWFGAPRSGVVVVKYGRRGGFLDGTWERFGQEAGFGTVERDDAFGASLAVGDLDGDGVEDLAVGSPGEAYDAATSAGGTVIVLRGAR